ncbi:hypothetical protein CspeluHIS016_0900520 [Cutaneotrichosporon spelunceum]|uniref:Uncharacterized protein n=1 Tax=Cutaneotrichosporon spelunceum TaxID=1672016 RepID=A0AAD3TZP4_9TREE|nr:hypothetical protein CspeluHIS016_0900520 [Cutaneotrichosporon spelunceum]
MSQSTDPYQAKLDRVRANAADDSTRPFIDDSHVPHDNLTAEQARNLALWGNTEASGPPADGQGNPSATSAPPKEEDTYYKEKLERVKAHFGDSSTRPFMDDNKIQHDNLTAEQASNLALWGSTESTGPSGDRAGQPASATPPEAPKEEDAYYKEKLERVKARFGDSSTRPFMDDSKIQQENLTPEQARAYALWGNPDATGPEA